LQKPFHWLILGAGAIGTYIGVQLSLHDNRVVFIDKPEIRTKLLSNGLSLEIEGKQNHLTDPKIWTTLPDALHEGPFDVAVFALNLTTLKPAHKYRSYKDQLPPFLCLQNGVENERTVD
jgi:ketopantoate reductase